MNNYSIIVESPVLGNPKILKSSKKTNDRLRMECILQTVGDINRNKRKYTKKPLQEAIEKIYPRIKERSLLGELDHPISKDPVRQVTVLYKEASHTILELGWDGNKLIGVVETLRTPNGQIMKSLVEDNIPVGFSFRGMGDLREIVEAGTKVFEVVSPIKIITWDSVSYPSHSSAKVIKIMENANVLPKRSQIIKLNQDNILKLAEGVVMMHKRSGLCETADGLVCTKEGVCYLNNDFDKYLAQRLIKLID